MGKYKVYHIPGQKVGCTSDIVKRVEATQGYKPGEYEIIYETDDIITASKVEREYQEQFGYKTDRTLYHKLVKKRKQMHTNTTSFTTTFYKPKGEIQQEDIYGLTIETEQGTYDLDTEARVNWVIDNLLPSQFTNKRCFVYNKAMSEAKEFKDTLMEPRPTYEYVMFDLIRSWANERGLYTKGSGQVQYIKLLEEAGELAQALLKKDKAEIKDAVGDMVVVLTNLAELEGFTIEECIESAYGEISKRTGKMINGTFVKD